jgi:hypothetical protein
MRHEVFLSQVPTNSATHISSSICSIFTGVPLKLYFLYPFLLYRTLMASRLLSLWIYTQSVGHLEWVIGPPKGLYLNTVQQKQDNGHTTNIHDRSGIRTHDHSFRASEDSLRLRQLGYSDRLKWLHSSLTQLMDLSPSWEATICAATQ